MSEEFGEHLIRDQRPFLHTESLQILQIHSSMTVLLQRTETAMVKIHFVLSGPFLFIWCLFWIVVLVEDPNTAHYKISNRGSQVFDFYLLVFDRIHDAMHLTRCSGPPAEKQAHNIKDPAVYLTVDMGYFFIPVCTKLIWWVCCQKALFSVSSDNRSQCHLKFQSCLTTEFAGVCFWMSEENFSWNPPEQHVVI